MKHEAIKKLIPLYIDGGLSSKDEEIVARHLAECRECQEELAQYQANLNFLSEQAEVDPPPSMLDNIMEKIREEEKMDKKERAREDSWLDKMRGLLGRRLRVPVGGLVAGLAAIILIVLLAGPLQQPLYQNQSEGPEIYPEIQYNKMDLRSPEAPVEEQSYGGADTGLQVDRKIIQTANLEIEVGQLGDLEARIKDLISQYNGYISSSRNWTTSNGQERLSLQLRIPVAQFEQVLLELKEMGKVVSSSINAHDVTEEYIDVEARLTNLQKQEKRYQELLDMADDVTEILQIERELERVRSEIDSLQGRLQYLKNQVELGTINVSFVEPEPLNDSWGIARAIRQAIRSMINTFYGLIIRLGTWLPYLVLILVAYLIFKRWARKKDY